MKKVFSGFILVLLLVGCSWLEDEKKVNSDITSGVNSSSDLGPDSPHYVIGYYDMSENILDPGISVPGHFIDVEGNDEAKWSNGDPMIASRLLYSDFEISPFLYYRPNDDFISEENWFLYSFSKLSDSTEGFDELAVQYNDIDYNHNNYFNDNCAKDTITGIHIYVEPSYREGYEGLPIDDLVEIQFSTAREFIENGYSYDGIEDQFPEVHGNKKITLDEFNERENYLIGMNTMTFRLKQAPTVSGDYTFTLVYQDRDENGDNEFSVDIGPIPIIGEE